MAKLGIKQGTTRPEASQLTPVPSYYLWFHIFVFFFFLFQSFTVYYLILLYYKLGCLWDYKSGAGEGYQASGMVNDMILGLYTHTHTHTYHRLINT